MNTVVVIVLVAAGTFILRASLLAFGGPGPLPRPVQRSLPLVGPAVMAAIIAPAVLAPTGTLVLIGLRPAAAVVGILVAWRWRSIPLVLVAGLGVAALGLVGG